MVVRLVVAIGQKEHRSDAGGFKEPSGFTPVNLKHSAENGVITCSGVAVGFVIVIVITAASEGKYTLRSSVMVTRSCWLLLARVSGSWACRTVASAPKKQAWEKSLSNLILFPY